MHTYIQHQNQQANRRHIKITYLLMNPEPARGRIYVVPFVQRRSLANANHYWSAVQ